MLPSTIVLANYQAFDGQGGTVSRPSRFNIFLGPNNSGKSKLLQALQRLTQSNSAEPYLIDASGEAYEVRYTAKLLEHQAQSLFPPTHSGGDFGYPNWWVNVGENTVDSTLSVSLRRDTGPTVYQVRLPPQYQPDKNLADLIRKRIIDNVHHGSFQTPIPSGFFVAAERDIVPERATQTEDIKPNGEGVTNAVRRYLNSSDRDPSLVRGHLLADLNRMISPYYKFDEISVREHESAGLWEIYFRTPQGREVRLSQSGSGLKTLLCLLSYIHIKHKARDKPMDRGMYIIEEIENSLHPRMQRNVYQYLRDRFIGEATCSISTHSSVAIDFFQSDADVSFYQVGQSEGVSSCRRIEAFDDKVGALDALGIKASSALLSNFVVWVEGPTDRIYINKWLRIVSEDRVREGRDYVVMFYGGKLLSHLTLDEDGEAQELIRLLKINTKCAIVIDSDKSGENTKIRGTKRRLAAEAREHALMCWVTKGREIENFVGADFWAANFNVAKADCGQFSKIYDNIAGKMTPDKKIIRTKLELAAFVEHHAQETDFVLDWRDRAIELLRQIERANE